MPDVDPKAIRAIKGPPEYAKKVDMQKINLEVMKQWISKRIVEILSNDDDVVIDYTLGLLEERFPDPKVIQYHLTGFLEKEAPAFCKQLWNLLLSAQESKTGVPQELLEQKKEELRQEKLQNEQAAEEQRKRREQDQKKEQSLDEIRQRERAERGERRRGPRPVPSRDRSPPPQLRRDSYRRSLSPTRIRSNVGDEYRPRRDRSPPRGGRIRESTDTYIPLRGQRREFDTRENRNRRYSRSRSRSRSVSRSPESRRTRREHYYERRRRRSRSGSATTDSRSLERPQRRHSAYHGSSRRREEPRGRDWKRSPSMSDSSNSRNRSPSSSPSSKSQSSYRSVSQSPSRWPTRKNNHRSRSRSSHRGDRRGGGRGARNRRSPSYSRADADEEKVYKRKRSRTRSPSPKRSSRRRDASRDRDRHRRHRSPEREQRKARDRGTEDKRHAVITKDSEREKERSDSRRQVGHQAKETPSPGSKRRRSEFSLHVREDSPRGVEAKRVKESKNGPGKYTSEELRLREALLRDKIKRSRKNSNAVAAADE